MASKRSNKSHPSTPPKNAPKPRRSGPSSAAKSGINKSASRDLDPFLAREQKTYANPLPSREYTLAVLREHGAPMWPQELMNLLEIRPDEETVFARRLNAMERDGQLMFNRKGAICISEKINLIPARISGHPEGFGFAMPDDASGDLFLSQREMQQVMHGDRVLIREVPSNVRGKREGRVVEVLERAQNRLVGRVYKESGLWVLRPEDRRINRDILLPADAQDATFKLETGKVVVATLRPQSNRYAPPVGVVTEVLGNYADPGMEIEIALRKHDLPNVFPPEVLAAVIPDKVSKADWKGRRDLTTLPLVTIDGETARDFDDAVYAEPQGKGWRLVVAIADVSHYVKPSSPLDDEGRLRGNSIYFPRRVIPMLPEALSNGICSLNPQVERLCMVCDMAIGPHGSIERYEFYPAVMFSQARLTYTQVAEWLADPSSVPADKAKLLPHLQALHRLFQAFFTARTKRGAIEFDSVETVMHFDDQGKISSITPVKRNDAHRLIEECMLAANVCAADFLTDHPALYRNHERPTPEKLENLRTFLSDFALTLPGGDEPSAKDYTKLMEKIHDRPDSALLQTVLLRSMQQAVYGPENLGHFGLSYDAYTHFTSPIRRYPDLIVHRAIKAALTDGNAKLGNLTELGVHCSMTERRADEASRDVTNWLKCYFMQDRLGETYQGTVSGVTAFGVFVTLDDLYVDGLVHVSELGHDYYHYDAARHSLIGEKTGLGYRIGDRLWVKVARVDLETTKIDFVLGEAPQD